MKDLVFIIGDSPFLGEVEGEIHYIAEKYPTIGINNAIRKYSISTHIFQDMKFISLTNSYPEVKTVAPYMWGDLIQKDNKELLDSFTFNFKVNTKDDIVKNGKLAWCGFTHDYAISYCIMKDYSDVVLVGTADFTGNKHYLTGEEFKYSEKLKNNSKKFIEEICSKRANIVTCNPDSILDIPRVNLNEFLK
jgi:hypothetical protein